MGCLKLLNNSKLVAKAGGTKYHPLAVAYKREWLLDESLFDSIDTERQTLHVDDDNKKVALIDTLTIENGTSCSPSVVEVRYQYDNHLGSACLELNENADIISYEEYHPFGTTSYRSGRTETEVSLKRYKYVGKERDEETGLYYYGARYYAAWLCRFVSVDPLQHEYPHYTPYQYAGNKPISYIDLDGLEEEKKDSLPPKLEFVKVKGTNNYVTKTKFKGICREKYKFDFVSGIGKTKAYDLAQAKGATVFASIFIMAQASLESDWGKKNSGKVNYYNLFSIMGGPKTNIGTEDGNLKNFKSYESAFNFWWNNFNSSKSKFSKEIKFPGVTETFFKMNSFSPDDVNKYYHQFDKYPSKGSSDVVYLGGVNKDYGRELFIRMELVIAMMISQTGEQIRTLQESLKSAKGDDINKINSQISILNNYLSQLRDIETNVKKSLDEHTKLVKEGKIKPNPNPKLK